MMKTLRAVELIATLSARQSGAVVQRQVFERGIAVPDRLFALLVELLVVLDFLNTLAWNWYDFWFVGWGDDLALIRQAVYELFQAKTVGQYG